ncbi:MAG TPA: hypothetical protein VKR06_42060 [Ktedonosporobacter sp.]|nr:hypothetical protein [Ktedonosporobacter sp.]
MGTVSLEQRQQLKQKYGELYETFIRLLAEYDPMGLLRMGAPHDEYDLEVGMILLRLHGAETPHVLGQIIYEEFDSCFGKAFTSLYEQSSPQTKDWFAEIGESVWNAWKHWKEKGQK